MLSDSWLKDKHHCLVFVKVHIRDKGCLEGGDDQDQESDDSDHHDVQVDDSSEESEHSCHNHHI